MRARLYTKMNLKDVKHEVGRLNGLYVKKLTKAKKAVNALPGVMMGGNEVKKGKLTMIQAMLDNISVLQLREFEDEMYIIEVDDFFIKSTKDTVAMKAIGLLKNKASVENMLDELKDSFEATSGEWIDE